MTPTLHFLPGTMCDERLWQPLWHELGDVFELHFVELPQADSFDHILSQLATRLPDEPLNLVGFSLGGYIAGLFATRFPARVRHLCMLSSSPEGLTRDEHQQRRQTIQWVEKYGYRGIPPKKINHMLHDQHRDHPILTATIQAMDATGGQDKLLNQLKSTTRRQTITNGLATLPCPVHFAYGDHDRLFDNRPIVQLANTYAHIQAEEIPGAGHMLPLESPQLLADRLTQWFSR